MELTSMQNYVKLFKFVLNYNQIFEMTDHFQSFENY